MNSQKIHSIIVLEIDSVSENYVNLREIITFYSPWNSSSENLWFSDNSQEIEIN